MANRKSGLSTGVSLLLMAFSLGLAACTSRQVYDASEGWRHHECNQLLDYDERARCMETATMPYDAYRNRADEDERRQ